VNQDESLWKELGLDVDLHRRILDSISRTYAEQVEAQTGRPTRMAYFDGVIHGAHGARVREIIKRRANGDKFVGTFCIYVPEEILIALGAVHLALCGGTSMSIPYSEGMFPRNMCPLVKSTLGLALSRTCPYGPLEDLAVGETTCDAKKKTWDVLGREGGFHVLEVPQKKNPVDRKLWLEEVREFTVRIEELTGRKLEVERLSGAIRLMNRKRRALARLHDFRKSDSPPISGTDALVVMQAALIDDAARFALELEHLNRELEERRLAGISPFLPGSKRIMIAGCPSVIGNWKLHHIIESAGAVIVVDETCTGTRYFMNEVEETTGSLDDGLAAIAGRYLKVDCSCFSPNTERLENVIRLAREFRPNGIIQYILHACHTYNIEAITVAGTLKEAGLPSLKVETDYSEEDAERLRLRVEAFIEALEQSRD
jgi:benzoyl-CoA reductase/2-hydroxyglutaryl-CoA dehydratase subunit BcrC/BadD/HgdB